MTDTLSTCRNEIDAIDAALVDLLAKRYRVVDRVIAIKQREGLPAAIPGRIEEVVAQVKEQAAKAGVPAETVETLWRTLIDGTIAYERARARSEESAPPQ